MLRSISARPSGASSCAGSCARASQTTSRSRSPTPAARHLRAAIDLTDATDPSRPRLLFDHATASYRSGAADERMLTDACDALVAAGDWWAAAEASMMLSEWFDNYAGRSGSTQWE